MDLTKHLKRHDGLPIADPKRLLAIQVRPAVNERSG